MYIMNAMSFSDNEECFCLLQYYLLKCLIFNLSRDIIRRLGSYKSYKNNISCEICFRKRKVSFSHSCVGSHVDQGASLYHKRQHLSFEVCVLSHCTDTLGLIQFDIIRYCTAFLFLDRPQAFLD